jgi:plastocyanin domain-containing protein
MESTFFEATMRIAKLMLLMALLAPAVQAQEAKSASSAEKVFRATVNAEGVQVVGIVGGSYYFDPNRIIVKVNVPVELIVRKEGWIVPHDINIDAPDAGVQVKESLGNEAKSIKLTFTKTGEYAFYCGKKLPFLKGHRERGMEGKFEVVE